MKSRAHVKAHPLHPALIPFPFAFLAGAMAFDLAGLVSGNPRLSVTAAHLTLAGIGAGLLAAVPGVIDYIFSVPPNSSGKARALRHGAGNVTALALFALAFALRRADWTATPVTILVQAAGALILGYAGWLGGTLVTRNLISVDHRYADRGKWQEASFRGASGKEIVVAHEDDLQDGHMKLLRVNGRRITLARVGGVFHAVDDGCTHRGGSLAGGVLVGGTVQCLWHGSQFDVRSGAAVCGPARKGIDTFAVRQANGQVFLKVP
ncbi:MAG TPA: DUF2231 domain-containing protein [Vicinamibacterales bacterium]|nr:DUF2231 domain-containing protein [Vicinamibacterales bacterium]